MDYYSESVNKLGDIMAFTDICDRLIWYKGADN